MIGYTSLTLSLPFLNVTKNLFFGRNYSIFKSFGDPHFGNGLGWNLDRLASLRISAYSGLSFGKNDLANARHGE